jgi:DnaD/phage-associated family protein
MKQFDGFPARMNFTPVPNLVFSSLLPRIRDITELKALLHIFALVYPKKGKIRFVTGRELLGHMSAVGDLRESQQAELQRGLAALAEEGIILHLAVNQRDTPEDIYFVNSEANRRIVEEIIRGEVVLPEITPAPIVPLPVQESPDTFTLYEQNIGMLTPLIAEELKEAYRTYPEVWIKDAIKEAAAENKRSWKYVSYTLERWSAKGKDNGTHRGNSKANTDPDKYIRGRYGHMVQR